MGTEFSVGEDKSSGGGWCDGCTTMPTPIMQQPYHLEIANFTYALPHTHTHTNTLVKTVGRQVLGVGK